VVIRFLATAERYEIYCFMY